MRLEGIISFVIVFGLVIFFAWRLKSMMGNSWINISKELCPNCGEQAYSENNESKGNYTCEKCFYTGPKPF